MRFLNLILILLMWTEAVFAVSTTDNNKVVGKTLKVAGQFVKAQDFVDGTFENGVDGWVANTGTITTTTAQKVNGSNGGLWSITGAGTLDICGSVTNLSGTQMAAEAWIKSSSLELQACSYNNGVESGCGTTGNVTNWTPIRVVSIAQASGSHCFRLKHIGSGSATVYVDDGAILTYTDRLIIPLPLAKENVFSARITSAGAIASQSSSWISSVTKGAAGIYTINIAAGIFTISPSAVVTTNQISQYYSSSSTSSSVINVRTYLDNGVLTDQGFDVVVTKQGADYTSPGVFISNINPDGFNKTSGTTGLIETFSFSYGTTNASTVCSASPCSYLDQIGNNVTSVTRNSAGSYTANFGKTFTKLKCAFGGGNGGAIPLASEYYSMTCASCNSMNILTARSSTEAAIDSFGTILCQGY